MSKPIKSTLEIAMEKLAKLPKLTEEEIRERREREYGPLGGAIAKRFLSGDLTDARLEVELFKHEDERGEIVQKAFVECMCQSVDLEDPETTAKVFRGAQLLVQDARLQQPASRFDELFRDFERRKQWEMATLEEVENARVRDLGISGSAIRLNLQENEGWRQKSSDLQREFRPKLDEIRRELTHLLVSSCAEREGAETRGS